jgi:hypothetical protein
MTATLNTDLTVRDICDGFVYNELEGKGLFGWGGKLVIQPEYQRNYIYNDGKKDAAVVESLEKGYPIGLLYFVKSGDDTYEVLDGQQRITSFGRFATGKLAVRDAHGMEQYVDGIAADLREKILSTRLTVYVCEGTESEIKAWFRTINIAGVPLNEQELLNAVHSGPFVTAAKEIFSNSQDARVQKWSAYVRGSVSRQDVLATALAWVTKGGDVGEYMSRHRFDATAKELETYFTSVIDWADGVFPRVTDEMCGLEWGRLYETYHKTAYNPAALGKRQAELLADDCVSDRRGIYEYLLGGEKEPRLLNVRVFDKTTARRAYEAQTAAAIKRGVSNCPLCALGHAASAARVWDLKDMDADHVTAWSKGGETSAANCQMLCKTHNRAKGNR